MEGNPTEDNLSILPGFREDLVAQGKSPTTIVAYMSDAKIFAKLFGELGVRIDEINNSNLVTALQIIRDKGLSQGRIENMHSSLSSLLEYRVFLEKRAGNPIPTFRKRYLKRYKKKNGAKVRKFAPSLDLVSQIILTTKDPMERAIHMLLAKTMIRRSALLSINLEDVDLVKKSLRLRDSRKLSTLLIPIDDECAEELNSWLHFRKYHKNADTEEAMFLNSRGERLGRNRLGEIVSQAGIRFKVHDPDAPRTQIDKKFTPHSYRHFCTTQLRRSGCPERIIGYLRGDAPTNIRDHYDHLEYDEVEQNYNAFIWKLRW